MELRNGRIRWAPRLPPEKIRRLYRDEASGSLDEHLVDEVAFAIFARCSDILKATRAHGGEATCAACSGLMPHRWHRSAPMICEACGWETTWAEYFATFQRRQLMSGGATPWIQEYLDRLPRAHTARERFLLIDRLIHQFHWGLKHPSRTGKDPQRPTRPAAVNFIEGTLRDVLAFLDQLAEWSGSSPETRTDYMADRAAKIPHRRPA